MNLLEHELCYPFGDALPASGTWLQVEPGIRWLRMPLPFALDHINLYLLEDEIEGRAGWTLIDCGVASEAIRQHWETIFASGLDGKPILRVICTHTHPDHVGLAGMICARFNCGLWMTLGEYTLGRILSAPQPGGSLSAAAEESARHFALHGVTNPELLDGVRKRNATHFSSLVPDMPRSFRRIRADEAIRIGQDNWSVIIGTGHSPEHASLYCAERELMLAGDMVLPRISTNVSVFEIEPEANAVKWFLDSLQGFLHCAPDTLVLPSHGRPFRGLHRRIAQLGEHHEERLAALLTACEGHALSAHDALKVVFGREFDLHQLTFALGESLAHLHYLWYAGKVRRQLGADGVIRFCV
jgi:glyoxylase-like metal-dependent hydrolase (beta-lactamase superfamily II)